MAELFRCRTGVGPLVVTDEGISVRQPKAGSITGTAIRNVPRSEVAGADVAVQIPPIFGRGGAMNFTIRLKDGSRLTIPAVPWKEAKQLKAYLGIPDM